MDPEPETKQLEEIIKILNTINKTMNETMNE